MSTMNFPLLYLPHLAIENVLSNMDPFQIINFTVISRRALRIVHIFPRLTKNYSIEFSILENPVVCIQDTKVHYELEMRAEKEYHDNCYETELDENLTVKTMEKYSEDLVDGWKHWAKYVKGVFNCPIALLRIDLEEFTGRNKEVVDFVKLFDKPIQKLDVLGAGSDVKYLFENLTITDSISMETYSGYPIDIPRNLQSLSIENAQGLQINQILEMDFPKIELRHSSLTGQDMNRFLRSWMDGDTNSSLSRFQVHVESLHAVDEIMNVQKEIPDGIVIIGKYNDEEMPTRGGFTVRRVDETIAKIFICGHNQKLLFTMYVL